MHRIVLATGNRKKLAEMQALLASLPFEVLPQSQFNIPDAIEDGQTFIENAIIKARHAARLTGLPAIADDSGIAVDALGGEPGIYSARFAGEPSDDAANNRKLEKSKSTGRIDGLQALAMAMGVASRAEQAQFVGFDAFTFV